MTSSKCFNDYAGDFSVFDWQPVLGVSMVFTQCMLGQATASVTLNKCREIQQMDPLSDKCYILSLSSVRPFVRPFECHSCAKSPDIFKSPPPHFVQMSWTSLFSSLSINFLYLLTLALILLYTVVRGCPNTQGQVNTGQVRANTYRQTTNYTHSQNPLFVHNFRAALRFVHHAWP